MKVNGQLELAQLEQISSASPTPTPTGRIYIDITSPLAAIPRFYNGTAWVGLATTATSGITSQNSGMACTVDWSTGPVQQVVLTGNAVISFSNAVSGTEYTLTVTQNAYTSSTPTIYLYTLNMIDQDPGRRPYQPPKALQYGENQVYRWFYKTSIRPGYATISARLGTPQTAPGSLPNAMDITPDGRFLAIGNGTSPYNFYYPLYDAGVKPLIGKVSISTSATGDAATTGIAYSPNGDAVFYCSGTTPFIRGMNLDTYGGTNSGGSYFSNPGTVPTGAAHCIAVHPAGSFVGVGHTTTPFMSIYSYSSASYVKVTNPVTLPAALVNGMAWSPTGDFLACSVNTTPFIQVWNFNHQSATVPFGAICSAPGSLPPGVSNGDAGHVIAWRPQGDYIAMASNTTPFLYVVPFNRATGAFGTALTIAAQAAATQCVAWTPDGQYLLVGTSSSPYFSAYDFSAQTIGSTVAVDSAFSATVSDIKVSPSGDFIVTAGADGANTMYLLYPPSKAKNYLRLI